MSGAPHPPSPGTQRDRGHGRQNQLPTALPRPAPQAPPLHDSPGPAQVAPSVGLGAREPGSPRGLLIGGPPSPPSSQQPPDANRRSVLGQQDVAPVRPCAPGLRKPRPQLPGAVRAELGRRRRGAGEGGGRGPEGPGYEAVAERRRQSGAVLGGLGTAEDAVRALRSRFPSGRGLPSPAPTHRHTPRVKTSQ